MKRHRIGVIGRGHVGAGMIRQLSSAHDVVSYDRSDRGDYPEALLRDCDFAMVCVDTPSRPDGSVDVSNVEAAVAQLPCDKVLIRSTVPPGTTARLAAESGKSICFSPEYIGETDFVGSPWDSFSASQPFMIIGGEDETRRRFADLLAPIYGPAVRLFLCSSGEAELVKYMENSYFAAKVIFVNQFRELSEKLGLDWHAVREGWLLDPRVERDHTTAFIDDRGFGGKCLPKDVAGIVRFAESVGVDLSLLDATQQANSRYRAQGEA